MLLVVDVPAHVPGDHAGIEVVGPASAVRDVEVDGLAAEELRGRGGRGGPGRKKPKQEK